MKMQIQMNVNKIILFALLIYPTYSFSQKKQDVYFFLDKDNDQYTLQYIMHNKDIGYINLLSRKEYEHHKKKVKEAKEKGTYRYSPDSGRDNLKIKVPKLTFEVILQKKIRLNESEISQFKSINYEWIKNNSWKKIAKQPHDFKDIYFLKKLSKNTYISYKVGLTIVAY
jgi:hypothetical protein